MPQSAASAGRKQRCCLLVYADNHRHSGRQLGGLGGGASRWPAPKASPARFTVCRSIRPRWLPAGCGVAIGSHRFFSKRFW